MNISISITLIENTIDYLELESNIMYLLRAIVVLPLESSRVGLGASDAEPAARYSKDPTKTTPTTYLCK